jgi:DNA-binding NtrC family response regulator
MILPQGISGLELAERFQKERPGLKVIITSGYSAEISEHGIPPGPACLYLPKPFAISDLANALRSCLDQK